MSGNKDLVRYGNIYGEQFGTGYAGNVWKKEGVCPTIKCESGGGNRVPMIVVGGDKYGNNTSR